MSTTQTHRTTRRADIDRLRAIAVLVVFVYHTTRFFNRGDWLVKNSTTYFGVEIWNFLVTRWMMPLFFVLSGASIFYALGKDKGVLRFLRAKSLRLLVPVIVAAFSHGILQVYLERISHDQFSGSFLEFLPRYFDGVYLTIGGKGNFAFHGMHLWYLLFLFFYGLMLYPLFRWLKGCGKNACEVVCRILALPGVAYVLLPLPLFIMKMTIPESVLRVGSGGWGFLYYAWFLIAGFIIMSSERLQETLRKQSWVSLAIGAVLTTSYSVLRFTTLGEGLGMSTLKWLDSAYSFVGAWALLLAILGLGMKYLRSDDRSLRYASEAGIAFYILHQTIIVCVGYFVVQWAIPDVAKWIIISAISFLAIIALYEFAVRRLNVLRLLFGMKPMGQRPASGGCIPVAPGRDKSRARCGDTDKGASRAPKRA